MHKKLLISVVCLFYTSLTYSQAVVYGNKTTGSYGVGYNVDGLAEFDNKPTTMANLEGIALNSCGKGCQIIFKSNKTGSLVVLSGHDKNNNILFAISDGNANYEAAVAEVRKKYKEAGGVDPDNISVGAECVVYNTSTITTERHFFDSLDSLVQLYNGKKLSGIKLALKRLLQQPAYTSYDIAVVKETPLSINITHSAFDKNLEATFYGCLEHETILPSLRAMYLQNRITFSSHTKHGGAGGTAGASYDPDPMPDYGFNNTDTKALDNYMQLLKNMTNYPPTKTLLATEHNQLKDYQQMEKNTKMPVLIMRRKFISFLHSTYKIPYRY